LDVEDSVVRARWTECGDWQAMQIQKEAVGAVFSGNSIHLTAHTGNLIEVEGTAVQARWTEKGLWQKFTIESYGGRAIFSGDGVFLKAHTGMFVDVQDVEVQARWGERGDWQKFYIERKDGSGAVMPGDTIFLRSYTNKVVEVDGVAVQARWDDTGLWQSLVIEKAASSRRLSESAPDESTLGALVGAATAVLVIGMLVLAVVVKSARMRSGKEVNAFHRECPYKVQPMQDEDVDAIIR